VDEDIFDDEGALTAAFLLARGYCCANGCRNCPYLPRHGGIDSRAPEEPQTEGARTHSPADTTI
jgi:hypothetical protein